MTDALSTYTSKLRYETPFFRASYKALGSCRGEFCSSTVLYRCDAVCFCAVSPLIASRLGTQATSKDASCNARLDAGPDWRYYERDSHGRFAENA